MHVEQCSRFQSQVFRRCSRRGPIVDQHQIRPVLAKQCQFGRDVFIQLTSRVQLPQTLGPDRTYHLFHRYVRKLPDSKAIRLGHAQVLAETREQDFMASGAKLPGHFEQPGYMRQGVRIPDRDEPQVSGSMY